MDIPSNYKNVANRLESYASWENTNVTPQALSEAGFFYTGVDDIVECPYCHINGFNWLLGDDPMSDHALWASNCPFVINGNDVDDEFHYLRVVPELEVPEDIIEIRPHSVPEDEKEITINNAQPICLPESCIIIDEKELCKICFVNKIDRLIVPCGHLVFCGMCSLSINVCPLCRVTISHVHKAYLP